MKKKNKQNKKTMDEVKKIVRIIGQNLIKQIYDIDRSSSQNSI